jgi:RNA polymerase sigma factor (sigma-70 family)
VNDDGRRKLRIQKYLGKREPRDISEIVHSSLTEPGPEESVIEDIVAQEALKKARSKLSISEQEVVELVEAEWPVREIAETLGKSVANVRQIWHRARKKMKENLRRDGYTRDRGR